jgi:hypothetical protein
MGLMVAEKVVGLVVEEGEDIRLLLIHFCLGNKIYISTGMAVGFVTGDQRQARNNPPP